MGMRDVQAGFWGILLARTMTEVFVMSAWGEKRWPRRLQEGVSLCWYRVTTNTIQNMSDGVDSTKEMGSATKMGGLSLDSGICWALVRCPPLCALCFMYISSFGPYKNTLRKVLVLWLSLMACVLRKRKWDMGSMMTKRQSQNFNPDTMNSGEHTPLQECICGARV